VLRVLTVLATIASALVLVIGGYSWLTYRTLVTHLNVVDAIPSPAVTGSTGTGSAAQVVDGTAQNILLVGNDDRSGASPSELVAMHTGDDGGGVLTDTVMVLHVPADGSKAVGISLPRDSWVQIPGFGMNKLNAAYSLGTLNGGGAAGGAQLLIKTVQDITGLHIDHYVAVSMLGFLRIAKALGPINVCLNQATSDPYSGTNLPAGVSTLNATQALAFVRQRHNLKRGDIDRQVRQQYFLSTELHKLTSAGVLLNPLKVNSVVGKVSSSLTMDPGLDPLKFAVQMQNISDGAVRYATIPFTGYPTIYPGGIETSIVSLDWAAIPAFVAKAIGYPDSYRKAVAADPATVTVDVIDASKGKTLGEPSVAALTGLGFHASLDAAGFVKPADDSADYSTLTTIRYPKGMQAAAKAVARVVRGAAVTQDATVSAVTLTMGTDGRRVKAPVSSQPDDEEDTTVTRPFTSTDCIN
jgi:LCP family protein required for cell wall assembly